MIDVVVVVFEGSTPGGALPLITVDGSGLHSTNYSAAVKHNVSTLVVGEALTLNSVLWSCSPWTTMAVTAV